MRGTDVTQDRLFSYFTLEDYVPEEHPPRSICEIVNAELREMDETFAVVYTDSKCDSTAPAPLLREFDPAVTLRTEEQEVAVLKQLGSETKQSG